MAVPLDLASWRREAFPDGSVPSWAFNREVVAEITAPAQRRDGELARLRRRVAQLEAQVATISAIAPEVIGKLVRRVRRDLEPRIAALEQREPVPVALPSAADIDAATRHGPVMCFRGVWNPTLSYAPGDFVTRSGAGWVATSAMAAGIKPGEGNNAWVLAVKSAPAPARKEPVCR